MLYQGISLWRFFMKKASSAKRKAGARRTSPEPSPPGLWVTHLGKGLLITLASGVGILVIFSLVAYFYTDPNALILPLALAGAGLTALIGGLVTVRMHGHSALFCGLLNGCMLMVVMMVLSLFFTKEGIGYSTGTSCLLHAGVPILSVLGAYLGLRRSPTKKHRK